MLPIDLPPKHLPIKSIIICSTGRSGSTLLSRTLSSLNYFGKPIEFFRLDMLANNGVVSSARELYDYLPQVYALGTTPNQVFSVKLHWDHLRNLLQIARTDPTLQNTSDIEILTTLFPNPVFIFIRRHDLVRQAISMEIGNQTGVYLILKDQTEPAPTPNPRLWFRPLNIYRYKQGLEQRNQNWRSFFKRYHVSFTEVIYEDLVKDFDQVIRQVITVCNVDVPMDRVEITHATQKQGNQVNERWWAYYQWLPETLLGYYSKLRSYLRQAISKD